jgi:hypothetical protein
MLLAGCGSVHEPTVAQQRVVVDDLTTGVYAVSSGTADAAKAGRYYAGADGSRLLVLDQANGQADALYRRPAGGAWRAVPAVAGKLPVKLLRSDPAPAPTAAVSIADLAGNYVVQEASGVVGNFTVRPDGSVVAGASACKLSGKLSAGTLPTTLRLSLKTRACGTLPATSTGVLALNDDDTPARFRLVADNGRQLIDLWAFAD